MKMIYLKVKLPSIPATIVLPVILSIFLFVMAIFMFVLPSLEDTLMANRRNLLHNLTEVAISTLNFYQLQEEAGTLSRDQAQKKAISHIKQIKYGNESKDYFWINDMHPNMIMHPYRTDLDNTDISNYADPSGKKLFVEFVKIVNQYGSGYVDYQWQWKDDGSRIVPKISFVKGFKPWNWIIGTGIYVDDIQIEIHLITKKLTLVSLAILLILAILSFFIIWQVVDVEKEKQSARKQAKLQQEQLFQASKMVSIGTLVSGVAHEINNPVTSIMLNAALVKKVWDNILPIVDEYSEKNRDFQINGMDFSTLRERIPLLLDHIEDGARRIKLIVFDLKDFARTKPPEMDDKININHSVRKSIGLISNLINKSTKYFSVDYRMNLPDIKGNSQKIEQVIINLIVNSCQALQSNKDRVSIQTGFDISSSMVIITIKDNGVGIPFEKLEHIKDPFFTTKQERGNTGLGLAISDRIIQDHGGNMKFSSFPGEGTCVELFFPITQTQ